MWKVFLSFSPDFEELQRVTNLHGVMDALRTLAQRYARQDLLPEPGLVKLFAYGFGFADRAANFGRLAGLVQRLHPNAPRVPTRIFHGTVRDLVEVAGLEPRTLTIEQVDANWSTITAGIQEQQMDLFGTTPMRVALEQVAKRFAVEFSFYIGTPHSNLFLVSDGESTDGSPIKACRQIASKGTVVFACYLTGRDIAEPRRLHDRPQSGWPDGAVTLFRCASVLGEGSILLPLLREKGWAAAEGDRLFVQLNQSELVSEFASFIFELATRTKRP